MIVIYACLNIYYIIIKFKLNSQLQQSEEKKVITKIGFGPNWELIATTNYVIGVWKFNAENMEKCMWCVVDA